MNIEWISPVWSAFKNRHEIATTLEGGLSFLLGKRTSIAITGMQGVGKTVLVDHLTGKAFQAGYQLPLQSQAIETAKLKTPAKRIVLSVVPGQVATPRFDALETLFESKRSVQGVIHVVANGLASIRTHGAIQTLIKDARIDTIAKIRKHQLERELQDLDETCLAIRKAHRKHHSPTWLILGVDKVDLYHDSLDRIRYDYAPEATNLFSDRLTKLGQQVGTDYFRWEAAPVCASRQKFAWHKQELDPQIGEDLRNAYLLQFLRLIESYCE